MRLFVASHRTDRLKPELPVLSGLTFESTPATVLDSVPDFFGQEALRCPTCTSDSSPTPSELEVSPEFFRGGRTVEAFHKFPFVHTTEFVFVSKTE